ncbi:MAG: helix-turn-helix domain-containing protein [Kiritimatiellae bacterium]|nr:helix-turn-helix domain-containing protein [Kiritimatiellia bacterium]
MIEFGKTLRAAREAKGYTITQVAEITRLAPSTVESLENEDFSGIAAPIYGRGFVKLYCEAVGLEAKPLVSEFMDIFSGNRDTEIKERPVVEEPIVEQAIIEPIERAPQETVEEEAQEHVEERDEIDIPVAEVSEPRVEEDDLFSIRVQSESSPETPRFSRYAAPMDQTRHTPQMSIPPFVWRLAALGAVVAVALGLLLFGARLLYRATKAGDATPEETPAHQVHTERAEKASTYGQKAAENTKVESGAQNVKREMQKIPALYID